MSNIEQISNCIVTKSLVYDMILLQLEDDVITKPGYLTIMKDFVLNQKMTDWILLEFSHLGFIGDSIHNWR